MQKEGYDSGEGVRMDARRGRAAKHSSQRTERWREKGGALQQGRGVGKNARSQNSSVTGKKKELPGNIEGQGGKKYSDVSNRGKR